MVSSKKERSMGSGRTVRAYAVLIIILVLLISFGFFNLYQPVTAQQTQDKSDMAAADFPKLVTDYLLDLHARHPAIAAASGIHAWDGRLEDYSSAAMASEADAIKRFQSRLEKIQPLSLSFSDIFDYQIIQSNMRARLLELEQIKDYERNPKVYNDVIAQGLLQIAMFEYAPADSRLRHVIAKEKQVPRLLESARANLNKPPAIFLKIALESFRGTLSFIQNDLPKAFASVRDAKLQGEFKKSTKTAATAVAKHIKHLEQAKPDPENLVCNRQAEL